MAYASFFGAMLACSGRMWVRCGCRWSIYALVLGVMGWQAAEQWWLLRDGSALLAMVGALLFMLSDAALALNKFRAPTPHRDLIVMTTYYGALLLIAWSVQQIG